MLNRKILNDCGVCRSGEERQDSGDFSDFKFTNCSAEEGYDTTLQNMGLWVLIAFNKIGHTGGRTSSD